MILQQIPDLSVCLPMCLNLVCSKFIDILNSTLGCRSDFPLVLPWSVIDLIILNYLVSLTESLL